MREKRLEFKFYDFEGFRQVRCCLSAYLEEVLAAHPSGKIMLTEIALNEAVANALKACQERAGARTGTGVKVAVYVQNREELVLRIQDTGCGFPVEEKLKQIEHKMRDPALIEDDAWVESGRGLLIMRAVADRLKFSRLGNRVSLYISLTPKSDLNARPG